MYYSIEKEESVDILGLLLEDSLHSSLSSEENYVSINDQTGQIKKGQLSIKATLSDD